MDITHIRSVIKRGVGDLSSLRAVRYKPRNITIVMELIKNIPPLMKPLVFKQAIDDGESETILKIVNKYNIIPRPTIP
jgi:hypothetical protein